MLRCVRGSTVPHTAVARINSRCRIDCSVLDRPGGRHIVSETCNSVPLEAHIVSEGDVQHGRSYADGRVM